jgi:hypothetical protein
MGSGGNTFDSGEHCVTFEIPTLTMTRDAACQTAEALAQLRAVLLNELEQRHGPVLGGGDLAAALGHRSAASLRQARRRGQVAVSLFTLPKRRGHFALAREVADWLARARLGLPPLTEEDCTTND